MPPNAGSAVLPDIGRRDCHEPGRAVFLRSGEDVVTWKPGGHVVSVPCVNEADH